MIAHAVIGAGYGDEGKGLLTDFMVRKTGSLLVSRCNGGAQAGHTVVSGKLRHVFGHVSAGTFAGAHTYLSSEFMVNPPVLEKELIRLKRLGYSPHIFASPWCRITTLFDMAINSLAELARGNHRHGSCGMGINETATRNSAGFFLNLQMVQSDTVGELADRLQEMLKVWVPTRLAELKIDLTDEELIKVGKPYIDVLAGETVPFLAKSLKETSEALTISDPKSFLGREAEVVIEGAQGLGLDEKLGTFPHVTRSITGVASSILAAKEMGRFKVSPIYVTRAYVTRHGAGPLEHEGRRICYERLYDNTNVHNDWQGAIRYAPLDLNVLKSRITEDLNRGKGLADIVGCQLLPAVIAVTCVDQVGTRVSVVENGTLFNIPTSQLVGRIEKHVGIPVKFVSNGPSARHINPT